MNLRTTVQFCWLPALLLLAGHSRAELLINEILFNPPGPNFGADLRWGAPVGFVCTLAVAAGAWWSMRDELRP